MVEILWRAKKTTVFRHTHTCHIKKKKGITTPRALPASEKADKEEKRKRTVRAREGKQITVEYENTYIQPRTHTSTAGNLHNFTWGAHRQAKRQRDLKEHY